MIVRPFIACLCIAATHQVRGIYSGQGENKREKKGEGEGWRGPFVYIPGHLMLWHHYETEGGRKYYFSRGQRNTNLAD